jgi:hypothetical protein
MIELNLTAESIEQTRIKEYLENSVSDVLAEKIDNGVFVFKDGKRLINKKSLAGFLRYACDEARKQAEKGAVSSCIEDRTVFGWAIHYFEEDSIEGALYNEDGTEYKPNQHKQPSARKETAATIRPVVKEEPQPSLFDLIDETPTAETNTEEPCRNELDEAEHMPPKGFRQISETEYTDDDGEIYEVTEIKLATAIPAILQQIFGSVLIAR